ncbi:hypothetical protein K492DRAFT_219112 [Lichtheimia hyalospora FSU 10163]|nr:hypothetical protein K492DRAFT_219112 [Lichtheimia hyalospora FSU 10163]
MLPSLHAFLCDQDLGQYYDSFIRAGATDRDVPQLLHLNDNELNEFLSAVRMLPFHAVVLKKGIRVLRSKINNEQQPESSSPPPTSYHHQPSRDVIILHATIYGKNSRRPLTKYENAINEASISLALENPSLLVNKGDLFEQAKKRLLENGYQYKRGRSRSKLIATTYPYQRQPSDDDGKPSKRKLNAQRLSQQRQEKLSELQVKIKTVVERQQQHPEEMAQWEPTRQALVKQVSKIKSQERKHQWYERRKTERADSGFSEESFESQDSVAPSSQESSQQQQQQQQQQEAYDDDETESEYDEEMPIRLHSSSSSSSAPTSPSSITTVLSAPFYCSSHPAYPRESAVRDHSTPYVNDYLQQRQ